MARILATKLQMTSSLNETKNLSTLCTFSVQWSKLVNTSDYSLSKLKNFLSNSILIQASCFLSICISNGHFHSLSPVLAAHSLPTMDLKPLTSHPSPLERPSLFFALCKQIARFQLDMLHYCIWYSWVYALIHPCVY